VRLCDFGLSRHSSQSNIETLGKLRGTMAYWCVCARACRIGVISVCVAYSAPEAYLGEQFTAKADIYSFGIILCAL
jgi:serine/threonine protein kinase